MSNAKMALIILELRSDVIWNEWEHSLEKIFFPSLKDITAVSNNIHMNACFGPWSIIQLSSKEINNNATHLLSANINKNMTNKITMH